MIDQKLQKKSNFKSSHKTLKVENILNNQLYSLSLNPQIQFDELAISHFLSRPNKMLAHMAKILEFGKEYFNYNLHMESQNGRLHFHGIIQILKPLEFDIYVLPSWKRLMTYEIDTIDDITIWNKYCIKQRELFTKSTINSIIKRSVKFPTMEDNIRKAP